MKKSDKTIYLTWVLCDEPDEPEGGYWEQHSSIEDAVRNSKEDRAEVFAADITRLGIFESKYVITKIKSKKAKA